MAKSKGKSLDSTLLSYDKTCLNVRLQGEYIAEWNCTLLEYTYGEFDQNFGYQPCSSSNYKKCEIYKKAHSGRKKNA